MKENTKANMKDNLSMDILTRSAENMSEKIPAKVRAVVLAAGQGKRLNSEAANLPKVLRRAAGHTLLEHVLRTLNFIDPSDTMLVVGYMWEKVCATVAPEYLHVIQTEQLGTGHAVAQARAWLEEVAKKLPAAPILCCYGDMPLISRETYIGMIKHHIASAATCTILSYDTPLDLAYGRIIRNADGEFCEVVEDRDCTPAQKAIHEYNAGVYVFAVQALLDGIASLKNNNSQNEYYLTDIPGFLRSRGDKIELYRSTGKYEGLGVNTQADLDLVSRILRGEQG